MASQTSDATDGLDLSDLDLSSIEFSEREMQALSGLTPALSRRLQRQLLAHLPPRAAACLRRTLSLPARSDKHPAHDDSAKENPLQTNPDAELNASKEINSPKVDAEADVKVPEETKLANHNSENDLNTVREDLSAGIKPSEEIKPTEEMKPSDKDIFTAQVDCPEATSMLSDISTYKSDDSPISASQYCTLPRLRRRSTHSRDSLSPTSTSDLGYGSTKLETLTKEPVGSRSSTVRHTPDRPLLSKYLAPERNLSLDESYSSDSGSILSEPSYIAAYGSPAISNTSGLGFRRHSLRLAGDHPKKRLSRFLRSDFFEASTDDSIYAKHKKEKELETQKILKEIRDKRNKSLESSPKSPIELLDEPGFKDDYPVKKCLSPIGNLLLKDRSRSITPFFPILDKIKENTLDSNHITIEQKQNDELNIQKEKPVPIPSTINKESKIIRPKSYPSKNVDVYEDTNKSSQLESCKNLDNEVEDKKLNKESKLLRPKSYPTSSPSPEKVYVNRNTNKDESTSKDIINNNEGKTDVEVSFSITLPKKAKPTVIQSDSQKKIESVDNIVESKLETKKTNDSTLTLKKYQVVSANNDKTEKVNKIENQVKNGKNESVAKTSINENAKNGITKEEIKSTLTENQSNDKKGLVKKKIVKKVSSKSKGELNASDKTTDEKKKSTKKVKEKVGEDNLKSAVPKKKSVFQSIGQKLEKFASSKSNSPEKNSNESMESIKINRTQRENSVPCNVDPPTESNLIKRAVTVTDVAALENQNSSHNKTTVSKVLGLFKKFEPKEKNVKCAEKLTETENVALKDILLKNDNLGGNHLDSEEKPKRPTSLLLNGLGRKNRYGRTSSEDINIEEENDVVKKEYDSKNIKNSLKLDFSRLPRVKKIVPTSPVIEPQIINSSDVEKNVDKNSALQKNGSFVDVANKEDLSELQNRSRSRSRSTYSNSEVKSEPSGIKEKYNQADGTTHHLPLRSLDSITPEKEDIVDRIRRKSFYSRFNEKKQRRKSNLVGPGAIEYDPLARLHSHSNDLKYDTSPTSPGNYDLSPGLSVGSDVSPSTERYRSLLTDLPTARSSLRYDGINDKIDMYRSLDRNDFRKHPGRSYIDYDQPSSYSSNRYARTKSLFDSSDNSEDQSLGHSKESHKYNRANSLFSPGSYATYRPKRTRNSAIILKESEKEPSPENILDKIRQRKISISVTRKPDSEKDSVPRSNLSPKGESDCTERSSKVD